MEIDCRELKRQARQAMGLPRPRFWAVALVFFLVSGCLSASADLVSSFTADPVTGFSFAGLFCSILVALLLMVVRFGYQLWSLWTWRRLEPEMGALFQGFSVAGRVIVMQLLIDLRLLGWCLLLALGSGMVASVLLAVFAVWFHVFPVLAATLLIALPMAVLLYLLMLRYAMAPYLLADRPDDGPGMAVQRSVEMMRGRKWELFRLHLSFLGWQLINILLSTAVWVFLILQSGVTLGPAAGDFTNSYYQLLQLSNSLPAALLPTLVTLPLSLWLTPYTAVAQAGFYDAYAQQPQPGQPQMPPL